MGNEQGKVFWLGVDVAKESFDAALAPQGADPQRWARLESAHFTMNRQGIEALARWIGERLGGHDHLEGICVESTGVYSRRFATLAEAADLGEVSIVNPCRPRDYGRSLGLRDKHDRVDAAVLALYGVERRPPARTRPPHYAQLCELWRLHGAFQDELLRWRNRLEQTENAFAARQIRLQIRYLQGRCERTWAEIEQWVEACEDLARDAALMRTVPGVGPKTAVLVLAELGDLSQWSRNQVVSYAGLFPRRFDSGSSVYRPPRLAKGGNPQLRKGLFMSAIGLHRHDCTVHRFGKRLQAAGKTKMCAMGAMMRKQLLILRAVVRSGCPYEPQRDMAKT